MGTASRVSSMCFSMQQFLQVGTAPSLCVPTRLKDWICGHAPKTSHYACQASTPLRYPHYARRQYQTEGSHVYTRSHQDYRERAMTLPSPLRRSCRCRGHAAVAVAAVGEVIGIG